VPTLTDWQVARARGRALLLPALLGLATVFGGCGGEPTQREVKNAQAFEALLTAVSLKNENEVEGDAKLIEERYASGAISEAKYRELSEIIAKARAKDWSAAEKEAYEFRAQFGDRGSFFD
jgi:hypothetical protein